jgi:VCBS repeat protein
MKHLFHSSICLTLMGAAAFLTACSPQESETPQESEETQDGRTGTVSQEVVTTPIVRRIPLRVTALVDDACTAANVQCGSVCNESQLPANSAGMDQQVAVANSIYAKAGIEFYIRSFTRVQAPTLWCNAPPTTLTWSNVVSAITTAYPEVPTNAWPNSHIKPGTTGINPEWWHAAIGVYAPQDEVAVILRQTTGPSGGDFPHVGRVLLFSSSDAGSGPGNTFAHELGHYLGLSHVYASANGTDPETEATWTKAARWDLMFLPGAFGPTFFTSKAAAIPYEASLQLITNDFQAGNCPINPTTCQRTCTLSNVVLSSGASQLGALAWIPDPGNIIDRPFGVDIMDNPPASCTRAISDSQSETIWAFQNYEPNTSQEFIDRVGLLPSGMTTANLTASRSTMGLVSKTTKIQRNFCTASTDKLYRGDFNGDGRDDLLCNSANGTMAVDLANTKGEFWSADWSLTGRNFCVQAGETLYVGDFDGDGRADLLCNQSDGDMFIDYASATGQFLGSDWSYAARNFCVQAGDKLYVGNFNGTGGDDLLCNQNGGGMLIDYANLSGEFWSTEWTNSTRNFCKQAGDQLYVGNFNGAGGDDLLCNQNGGGMLIDYANSSGEFWSTEWTNSTRNFCNQSGDELFVANINGVGGDDIVCHNTTSGEVQVDLANVSGEFWSTEWKGKLDGSCTGSDRMFVGDINDHAVGAVPKADILCNKTSGLLIASLTNMD